MKNPKKYRDFDADSVKDVLKEAFDRAMKHMLNEAELNYVIGEIKKKDQTMKIQTKKKYFDKSRKTLELLMAKIGL